MKKIFSIFGALLAGAMMFSCSNLYDEEITFGTEITTNVESLAQFAAENAEAQTVEVTSDGDWVAVAPAWLEISPRSGGKGTTQVSVRAMDNYELVADESGEIKSELGPKRSATVSFAGEQDMKVAVDANKDGEQDTDEDGNLLWETVSVSAEVAISQDGDPNKWDPAVPRPVTMQYFNEVATVGDGFTYILTGKITEVANTVYGNFYFEDETGTAYVYGLLTPDGKTQTQWAAAGLKVNDVITVYGARGEYKGDPQMSNATYMSHTAGEASPIVDATIAEFLAAEKGGTQYRISGVVTNIAKAEYGNIYIKDATGEVYVYGVGAKGEFETMGVEVGDIVTLISNRGEYNGTPQAANSTLEKKEDVTAVASVTDFLALEESGDYYMLSGTVSGMAAAGEYGNIYLNDETSSIYVYGVLSGWKGAKKEFPALVEATGLKDGDTLTVIGKRTSYNDTPQVGSAFYFSHEAAQGGEEPEPEPEPTVKTIAEVLEAEGALAEGTLVEGVVISNMDLNNLTSKKGMYIQDETAGLQFYLAANHEFAFGDKVQIDLGGVTVGEYNGAVQVSGVALEKITKISSDNAVEAKVVTIADFLANKYEGQYVAIEGVQVAEADLANTWVMGGAHTSINIEDAEGNNFVVFSSKYATYGAETVAQGSGTIKGISSISNGAIQLIFAQASDYAELTGARFGGSTEPEPEPTSGPYESDAAFVQAADDSDNSVYGLGATVIGDQAVTGFKLGTSKKAGLFTSSAVGVSGDKYLNFYAVAWKGKTATLYFRVDGGEAQSIALRANDGATSNPPYVALTAEDADHYSVQLSGLTENSVIEFSTDASFSAASNSAGRAIVFGVKLTDEALGNVPTEPEIPTEFAGTGEGTEASPYDVTRALDIINNNAYTADNVYTKGIISGIKEVSTSYGNATYYISVDGTNTNEITVFRGKYLNNEKFTAEDQIKVGDEVVILGALTLYGSTPEINSGNYLISITPAQTGSEATAYTMTLATVGTTDEAGATTYAPAANITGMEKSFKEHTWTATDDSGKDVITFNGNVYYRTADACIWYFNKKNAGTTVSAEGFGKLKKITVTLQSSRLPDSIVCTDKEGNTIASTETAKSTTITWEFANATDGFTLLAANTDSTNTTYYQDLKISDVVIEYEK